MLQGFRNCFPYFKASKFEIFKISKFSKLESIRHPNLISVKAQALTSPCPKIQHSSFNLKGKPESVDLWK